VLVLLFALGRLELSAAITLSTCFSTSICVGGCLTPLSAVCVGSGIVFDVKDVPNDPVSQRNARAAIDALNTSQKAINEVIRLGAHTQGSTDYAKQWEDNKHVYFPTMFSPYKNLEIGQVVDGMRYNGGDAKADTSWSKVK